MAQQPFPSHLPPPVQFNPAQFFADYSWFILKNVIGWLLMLSAWPIGILVPGPGGVPLFLIGFALVTFPGKRQLVARVLRGRPLDVSARPFVWLKLALALIVPVAVFWYGMAMGWGWTHWLSKRPATTLVCYAQAAVAVWLLAHLAILLGNKLVYAVPTGRRMIRPWLRDKGIHLLPPRRKRRRHLQGALTADTQDEEILELHERHWRRLGWLGGEARRYLKFAIGAGLTLLIFAMMLRPIILRWEQVRGYLLATPLTSVIIPGIVFSLMFAVFLFVFRALVWRRMLASFGHALPLGASARIWTYSELARYIPGSIFQVIGRAYLLKPWGVSGSVSSTVQVLELTLFLLANVLLAVICLLWFGIKQLEPPAETWLYVAMVLVPLLSLIIHPKVYYTAVNGILGRIGKPAIVQRLSGGRMVAMLAWTCLGLLWQCAGVYIVVAAAIDLPLAKWWVVAGAYSLAWCAGFLAIFSSAGLGVREVVFTGIMILILPEPVRADFDSGALLGLMAMISFLLRLWTIVGELILTAAVTMLDFRGATGRSVVSPASPM